MCVVLGWVTDWLAISGSRTLYRHSSIELIGTTHIESDRAKAVSTHLNEWAVVCPVLNERPARIDRQTEESHCHCSPLLYENRESYLSD